MASKKKVVPVAPDKIVEVEKPAEMPPDICGHANLQRPDGKPLYCVLGKGHQGDHACPFGNGDLAVWSDAAGIPL